MVIALGGVLVWLDPRGPQETEIDSEEIRRRGHQWAAREAAHKNKQACTQKNTEKQPS